MMEERKVDLTICQDCKENPATYGDGLTWSRCSQCQLRYTQENFDEKGEKIESNIEGDKFPHKLIPGLTSIIIPVYMNSYSLFHYTGNCIGSVREHTDKQKTPYEIIIIDNGSPTQPPNLQAYYADKVVKHTENLGVTKAWNKGIRVSFGEYIVLLNNDTQVFEGWLEGLKEVIDSGETDLAMAHPMYSLTEPFARAVESKKVLEGKSIFDKLDSDFACVMFKKDLYNQIGAFDEQFFNYCQDVDYFKRMDQAGRIYKMIDKVAIHHISGGTGFAIPETAQIMNEDKAKFEGKWQKGGNMEPQEVVDQLNKEVAEENQPKIETIRSNETGDKIYLKKDERLHWIKNPETLEALGGHFGEEITLTKEEFDKFERGEPIDSHNVVEYK